MRWDIRKNCNKIVTDKKADYVIALKGNQGYLHDDVELFAKYVFEAY